MEDKQMMQEQIDRCEVEVEKEKQKSRSCSRIVHAQIDELAALLNAVMEETEDPEED